MQFKGVPVLVWTDVLKFLLIEESWLDVTSLNSLDNRFLLEFSLRYFMSLRKIAKSVQRVLCQLLALRNDIDGFSFINYILWFRYFTLFMNLMNGEKGTKTTDEQEEKGEMHHNASQTLHQNAVLAMSNLLNANIDTGLMYAIGKWNQRSRP